LVFRVHSSGGHTRMGQVCGNVNRNLKWACVETGNSVVVNLHRLAGTHVVRLYQRLKGGKESCASLPQHRRVRGWRDDRFRAPFRPRSHSLITPSDSD
jgi:hypothetical protein